MERDSRMSKDQQSISIIGIGDDGLAAVAESTRQLILAAEVLVGSERTLALVCTRKPVRFAPLRRAYGAKLPPRLLGWR